MKKKTWLCTLGLMLTICLIFTGCSKTNTPEPAPEVEATSGATKAAAPAIPEKLELDKDGEPILNVYNVDTKKIEKMDVEDYIEGVLAGEMKNDWPLEALKAQAILARTFVMQFVSTKQSQYEGADISTDIKEAQAYNADKINDNIKEAVDETEGLVISTDGKFVYSWFHAHAGGMTELASVGLDYAQGDPDYIAVVQSPDSEEAPDDVKKWTATFSTQQIADACSEAGVNTGDVTSIEIDGRGESGRVKNFVINGKTISAPTLRIKLGADVLKSTKIDDAVLADGKVTFTGSGFGHGVGMSQWGAYGMAKSGKSAEEIIYHYFRNIDIVELWD